MTPTGPLAPGPGPELSERWLRALYDSPQVFSALLDPAGTLLDASTVGVEGSGYERADVLGRRFWDVAWWGDDQQLRSQVRSWFDAVLVQGRARRETCAYVLADGTRRVADLALAPVVDGAGGLTHVVVTSTDITRAEALREDRRVQADLAVEAAAARQVAHARTQDLERLREVEAELGRALQLADKVLDNVGDGIYGLDADGRTEFVNPAAARLTGYDLEELLGVDVHALLHGRHPDGSPYPHESCPSARARRSGRVETDLDEVFWRRDGSLMPVSIVAVPILEDGGVTGVVVSFRDESTQREMARQAELLTQVTEREAVQRELVDGLQQALLTPPPEPDHLHVVVRYRPAAQEAQVGGDWYDAFLQPDGATMLVIGDVVGHDGRAAAKMGQLRGVLRTLGHSRDDEGPAAILSATERTTRGLAVDSLATVLLARLERRPDVPVAGSRTLRWSNAGHLPPVLLHADGSCDVLDTPPDLLLGVDPDAERSDHTVEVPDGSTLLMFTDGLVERRGKSLDDGLAALQDALADLAGAPLDELCDLLLHRLAPEAGEDDIALVAVRANPEDRPRPAEAGPNRLPPGQD